MVSLQTHVSLLVEYEQNLNFDSRRMLEKESLLKLRTKPLKNTFFCCAFKIFLNFLKAFYCQVNKHYTPEECLSLSPTPHRYLI